MIHADILMVLILGTWKGKGMWSVLARKCHLRDEQLIVNKSPLKAFFPFAMATDIVTDGGCSEPGF